MSQTFVATLMQDAKLNVSNVSKWYCNCKQTPFVDLKRLLSLIALKITKQIKQSVIGIKQVNRVLSHKYI